MLRLTIHTSTRIPLEAPCIVPHRLGGLALKEIERLPVQHGNRSERLGDFFSVAGDSTDSSIVIEGNCLHVKWIGSQMTHGSLHITGSAGMHCGSGMIGGTIRVDGDVDDWLGAEMRGGLVHVTGNAGHCTAAAYPGSFTGMRGGIVLVQGRTGEGTAAVMRRGLVAVGGCGDFAGASMIAGSLFVFGPLGKFAGMHMKRGTICAFGEKPELLPTFRYSGVFQPAFLPIYLRKLLALGYPVIRIVNTMRRYCGDVVGPGLGEILVPV